MRWLYISLLLFFVDVILASTPTNQGKTRQPSAYLPLQKYAVQKSLLLPEQNGAYPQLVQSHGKGGFISRFLGKAFKNVREFMPRPINRPRKPPIPIQKRKPHIPKNRRPSAPPFPRPSQPRPPSRKAPSRGPSPNNG